MTANSLTQVLIVGAGPTGLMAALELSRLGVAVRVVEKRLAPATTSRAIGVQARTLEDMELRGLADELIEIGNKAYGANVYGAGRRLFRLDFGGIESRYPYRLFVSQAETERVLTEALAKRHVAIEHGVAMIGFSQNALAKGDAAVSAVLRHVDGTIERVSADYLISAEGVGSVVRTTLDLRFDGATDDDRYALGDVHVEGDLSDGDSHIFSSEYGFMGLFPMGNRLFRLIASDQLGDLAQEVEPTINGLQATYNQRSHVPACFHDMIWSSWYAVRSRVVPRFRVGRLLLGGDSAHVHSPAAAQGMNTGMQDMINLCWKLAFVLKGHAPDELLDTYEQDRLPTMRNIRIRTEGLTEVIGSENALARSLLKRLGPWIASSDVVQHSSAGRMSQTALNLWHSPLSVDFEHAGPLRAGDRLPDCHITAYRHRTASEEMRLHEILDPSRFALLVINVSKVDAVLAEIGTTLSFWHQLMNVTAIGPSTDVTARKKFYNSLGSGPSLLLVRPDGYIGFAGNEDGAEPLMDYCRAWLTGPTHQKA